MHTALPICSTIASHAPGARRGCNGQLARMALVVAVFGGVGGLVVDVAAQAPQPPLNLRILRDGVAPPSPGSGTQPGITCAAGSISISPGASIQAAVNLNPGNSTFCLRAGTHTLRAAITPKTGDTFVGEYGAILDGTGWSTTDPNQGAFRAHNQDIDYVTIRNLVIRNMPQKGIHAFYWMSDYWTIEYTEIAFNKDGLQFPNHSVIRNNYIHHNVGSNPVDPIPPAWRRLHRYYAEHHRREQRDRL